MTADRAWFKRNLGYDPLEDVPPANTYTFAAAAISQQAEDLQREIIEFDSEAQSGLRFMAFSTATGLSRFRPIPWPAGLAPVTAADPGGVAGGPLPKADVLVVTWTVDEGHALSRVLTPGKDSKDDYLPYTHNYAAIAQDMRAGCPAVEARRLGSYWRTTIAGKSVVVFKSDSHMSQDGPKLPNIRVWRQIIEEVQPRLVITTGTGGGIGKEALVGDVVVSPVVRFDCTAKFKNFAFNNQPIAQEHYSSSAADTSHFAVAKTLFAANAGQLPQDNGRPPTIIVNAPNALASCVVTTDFFGFDTSDDHYKLWDLGALSEMGDAVLGLVARDMGNAAPPWLAIRNVSDPQIQKGTMNLKQEGDMAAQIYKGFGRWSSICSAIVCWASIVPL